MVTHGTAFVEPVGGTGWSNLVTHSYQMNGQSKGKTAGVNNQYLLITDHANTCPLVLSHFSTPRDSECIAGKHVKVVHPPHDN